MKTKDVNFIGYTSQYWWLMLSAGILFIFLGVCVLASPVASYLSFSLLFSCGMLFAGMFEVIFAIGNFKTLNGWGWTLTGGLIDFFLGAYLLYFPLLSMVVMPVIMGLWMLFRGCMAVNSSLEMRAYGVLDWTWLMVTGLLIILLSLLIIGHPLLAAINVVVWTAFAFILSGIFRICLSLQLKRMKEIN
jgi:uncharacterized membrane protein HdeD (DUF308 family)